MPKQNAERVAVVITIIAIMGIALFLSANRENILSNTPTAFAASGGVTPSFACPSSSSMYISGSGEATAVIGTITRVTNSFSIPSVTTESCVQFEAQTTIIENTKTKAQNTAVDSCKRKRPQFNCGLGCRGSFGESSCTADEPTTAISIKHVSSSQNGSYSGDFTHTFNCIITANAIAMGARIAICEEILVGNPNPVSVAPIE